jgi:hypothetical protein
MTDKLENITIKLEHWAIAESEGHPRAARQVDHYEQLYKEIKMTDQIITELKAQKGLLADISKQLQMMLATGPGPAYRRPLADYHTNWCTDISAHIISKDPRGPNEVAWGGHRWKRRTASGKFGKAIWFSRATGKNGDDTSYTRLITFKDLDPPEPMHPEVVAAIGPAPAPEPTGPPTISPANINDMEQDAAEALDIQDTSTPELAVGAGAETFPIEDTPTCFWKVAVALQRAGKCSQDQCENVNQNGSATWLDKIATILDKYGPIPEGFTP